MSRVKIYLADVTFNMDNISRGNNPMNVCINMHSDLTHLFIDATVKKLVQEGSKVCLLTDNIDKYLDVYRELGHYENFKLVTFDELVFEGISKYDNHVIVFEVKNCKNAHYSTVEHDNQISAYESARKILSSLSMDAKKHPHVKYMTFVLDNYKGVYEGLNLEVDNPKEGSVDQFRNSFLEEFPFEIFIGYNIEKTKISVRVNKRKPSKMYKNFLYNKIVDKDNVVRYLDSLSALEISLIELEK